MDKTRLLTVIEELGEAIQQYKAAREDSNAEIEYLRHELKEHQSIIVDLEKKLNYEVENKRRRLEKFTPCIACKSFDVVDGVRKCCNFGLPFPDGTIQPELFGCNYAVERGTQL
ncbi:MAG: hypothetical protein IKU08_09105 [Clostridia bacterium]|nr:hypothetical protein [Clostridia bacterium]